MASTFEIKRRIGNRWLQLMMHFCPDLDEAVNNIGRHVSCLMHIGKNGDGFRLFEDADVTGGGYCNTCGPFSDGIKLLMALKGWTFTETIAAIEEWLLNNRSTEACMSNSVNQIRISCISDSSTDVDLKAQKDMNHVFNDAVFGHPRLTSYFRYRGLSGHLSDYIGYIERERYYENGESIYLPAMVCCFQSPDGTYVGTQRTYLDPKGAGKAKVNNAKKSRAIFRGAITGSAIRLFDECNGVIAVMEGIENAMAVFQATGTATWSTGSAGGMASFIPPVNIKQVDIWADNDPPPNFVGQTAAAKLALRLLNSGVKTRLMLPPIVGQDWLDTLVASGIKPLQTAHERAQLNEPWSLIAKTVIYNLLVPEDRIPHSVFWQVLNGIHNEEQ